MSVAPDSGRASETYPQLSPEASAERLEVDLVEGLDGAEAVARVERFGRNEIVEGRRRGPLRMFVDQFRDFMIVVLMVSAVVAGMVGEARDAVGILVIVFLNAVLGAVQELRADRALQALRAMAMPEAHVRREGHVESVSPEDVVPGDLVLLEAGDVVPADLRLIEVGQLSLDEAALTGESVPVDKVVDEIEGGEHALGDLLNLAFKGTLVTRGRALGVAIATGMQTELGRVAALLEGDRQAAPLQRRLAAFGRRLAIGILALCAVIFVAGLVRGEEAGLMFLTAVSMAVAAIPEALPAVVTIALALGSREMVSRKALIRHLPATEALGAVTVICSDKTGTLTQNRMHVERLYLPGEGWSRELAWHGDGMFGLALAVSNDVTGEAPALVGDPTEVAMVEAAARVGLEREAAVRRAPRVGAFAFDSDLKRMSTLHREKQGESLVLVKGAPEEILALCGDEWTGPEAQALRRDEALVAASQAAADGQRVLAFAFARRAAPPESLSRDQAERDLTFLGLAALLDPPRPEAARSVALCKSAGIRPVMITGDHPETAQAIALRLGIADDSVPVVSGPELAGLEGEARSERLRQARVFARVSPEQKIDIVESLQASGELVAMTGDGVNDAPALRRADIGVAMGVTGTDVAREAADMVLLDDNFATIVAAVGEGRRIFDNIRKFVRYTMTSNSGELWTLVLAPFLGLPLPLLPVQILWINLVTDGLPGLALTAEPAEPGVMKRAPRPPSESIFARGLWQHMIFIGLLIGAICLSLQWWAYHSGVEHWQTLVFTVLTLCQLAHAMAIRSEQLSLFTQGLGSNLALLGAVAFTLGLQLMVVYVPWLQPFFATHALPMTHLGLCLALPLIVFVAVELEKLLVRRGLLYAE
jgi:Ca2+-transporting ATPase